MKKTARGGVAKPQFPVRDTVRSGWEVVIPESLFRGIWVLAVGGCLSLSIGIHAQESTPKEEFKPTAKLSGEIFGDYYYKVESDTITSWGTAEFSRKKKDDNGFTLRRVHLRATFQLAPKVSGQILYEGDDGNLLPNGRRAAGNLRYAYLRISDIWPYGGSITIGAQETPTFTTFTDKIWGYRSIERSIFDARRLGTSNDVGFSISGYLDSSKTIGYIFMVGNGTAQAPENDKFKKIYGEINGYLFNKRLLFDIYADYEDLGTKSYDSFSVRQNKFSIKGFLAFQIPVLTVGVEGGFQQQSKMGAVDKEKRTAKDKLPLGVAMFVRGTIIKNKLNFFVRGDYFDNDNNEVNKYTELFFVGGLDFIPGGNAHIMPNIWINMYEARGNKPERKSDIVPRLTFWWKF